MTPSIYKCVALKHSSTSIDNILPTFENDLIIFKKGFLSKHLNSKLNFFIDLFWSCYPIEKK